MPKFKHPIHGSPVDGNYDAPKHDEGFLDKPRDWITNDDKPGEPQSIRQVGHQVANGLKTTVGMDADIFRGKPDQMERRYREQVKHRSDDNFNARGVLEDIPEDEE